MLWEVEIRPATYEADREAERVLQEARNLPAASIDHIASARSFLIQTDGTHQEVERAATLLLIDPVVETMSVGQISRSATVERSPETVGGGHLINVLFKAGVTDNVAQSTKSALADLGIDVEAVSTCRKYWVNQEAERSDLEKLARRILANDAIEQVIWGPLALDHVSLGSAYRFQLMTVPIRAMNDSQLAELTRKGQLFLSLVEMQTIRQLFAGLNRDPTDVELETIAQTWSEHCSHKTLGGRIHYRDESRDLQFGNMLKETIFAATRTIREKLGANDWCVSVFKDNAGVVKFDTTQCVCFKVETHNHPSALEP
jgi:phosphoribosylformylglycinamidine (FGAM) synthase PurS component